MYQGNIYQDSKRYSLLPKIFHWCVSVNDNSVIAYAQILVLLVQCFTGEAYDSLAREMCKLCPKAGRVKTTAM